MEALRIDAFANYTFLSGLRCGPQGELAFVAAQAEMEENSYRRDLWIKPPQGEPLQLTADGKTGGFLWDGPHTLLFQSGRHPQQKQRLEAGEEFTAFYRLDIRGGEAKLAFTVPLAASLAEKVREGVYLLSVNWDLRFSKAYAMKTAAKEALLAEKKEEKDYQVLDELPFYFNGAGYVNKHRTALFLFEEESGKLTRLTKESFDVSSAHLSPDGTQLLFTGESYTTKRKLRSGVYRYDFATGETAQLLAPRTYSLYDALWWGEKVLLLATDHKRYGMNENVQYLYDTCSMAVLRSVNMVCQNAAKYGVPVNMCGEAASDATVIPLWVAMGLAELSVVPGQVARTKYIVDHLDQGKLRQRLPELLSLATVEEVRAAMKAIGREYHILPDEG